MRKIADMPCHLGLKVKIYPSYRQKHLIAVNDGVKRAVYNHLVACGSERYRLKKTAGLVPAYRDRLDYLSDVTGAVRNIKNALPYLYGEEVDEQAIANAVKNYRAAWKNQKELHRGVPVFKKKSYEQFYQTNAHYYAGTDDSNVRFEDLHHVTLPKLGRIRMDGSPRLLAQLVSRTADTRIGTVTISRDAVGEYWASFSIGSEEPFREPLPKTGRQQGIDLNLLELVNNSDGGSVSNQRFFTRAQKKLAKNQKKLSRMGEHAKKEGRPLAEAKNYQKQRKKVASIHRKIQRQRTDCLHVISKREVENQDLIVAEDLKVANMKKNHHLAKQISDAGWRTFLTMLQYKAGLYGKQVILVPPAYTTQTCSACGYVMKGDEHLGLSIREWECPCCHSRHHRDTNAAKNILSRGLLVLQQQA